MSDQVSAAPLQRMTDSSQTRPLDGSVICEVESNAIPSSSKIWRARSNPCESSAIGVHQTSHGLRTRAARRLAAMSVVCRIERLMCLTRVKRQGQAMARASCHRHLEFDSMTGNEAQGVALGNGCQDELRFHHSEAI